MKLTWKSLWCIVVLALMPVTVSLAVTGYDDQGNPNDPAVNERANACFDGGTLEGKCDSDWKWIAGWYLIRFEAGIISRADFPAQYASVLPPLVVSSADDKAPSKPGNSYPPAGCYYSATYSLYIIWNGDQTQTPPLDMTWDGTCATPPHTGVGGFFLVSTPNAASAAALCATYGHPYVGEISSASDTGAWPIYRCIIL